MEASVQSPRAHRDADEEALQAALLESVQPDFLAEILQAETQCSPTSPPLTPTLPVEHLQALEEGAVVAADAAEDESVDSDNESDLAAEVDHSLALVDIDGDGEEDDANAHHVLLNFAEYLIVDILKYLDEDSVGNSICSCKRLLHVGRAEELFETLCRRIFPVQNPKVAVAAAANRFALRRFRTWFDMFHERPRVRYNGFYWLKISYYKKPELNMWTEITPGTILQVIYYRYFSFQRDGTVLYGMLFTPPQEATRMLREQRKDVYVGRYHVEKDEVFVSVPTNHNVVEFRLKISKQGRGKNVQLVLQEHYSFSEPDRTGWVDYYHTAEEEFQYYRSWNLCNSVKMAPIVSSRAKGSDNNSDHAAATTGNNRVRSTLSREKALISSTGVVKKSADEPAKKIVSSSSSARSSSSAGSSSRSTSATSKQPAKPESTTSIAQARKDPTAKGSSPSAPETPAAPTVKPAKSHPLPSTVLNKHKQAAVFTSGKKKHKTYAAKIFSWIALVLYHNFQHIMYVVCYSNFGSAYDSGSIPCRINHGGIKNALQWTKAPETLDFNPLLITCVEGFQEVEHPFVFLARTAFKDLMKSEDAGEKAIAVLPQVIQPLRAALMAKDEDIFLTALEATRILSDAVEGEMNVYLPKLTQQIHRKLLTKQLRAEVEDTLATLERNGGKEALAIIRSKIPTYVSVSF